MSSLSIIEAEPHHTAEVLTFIRELADYEKLAHEVVATEQALHETLFGPERTAEALIAYWGADPAGFALYFYNVSTFLGRRGLYLEDLFVRPTARGRGIGKALMIHLARVAVERDCGRFEWSVLDWNSPALDFYASLGAQTMDGWTVHRLSGAPLHDLARASY